MDIDKVVDGRFTYKTYKSLLKIFQKRKEKGRDLVGDTIGNN